MLPNQILSRRCVLTLSLLAALCGCGGPGQGPPIAGSSGRDFSKHFSASVTSDRQVSVRYEAPMGDGLTDVDLRVVPTWRLQSVLDGMRQSPAKASPFHWDSLNPGETRVIDLGEPPQLNDAISSIQIEGTAVLHGEPVHFVLETTR